MKKNELKKYSPIDDDERKRQEIHNGFDNKIIYVFFRYISLYLFVFSILYASLSQWELIFPWEILGSLFSKESQVQQSRASLLPSPN